MNDKYIYEIDTLWQLEKPRTIKFCCGILNKFYGGIQGILNSSKCIRQFLYWIELWTDDITKSDMKDEYIKETNILSVLRFIKRL